MRSLARLSARYGTALIIDLVPSKRLLGLILIIYGLAALPVLLWPGLLPSRQFIWVTLVGILGYRELARHGWARPGRFVHRLGCGADGSWFFEDDAGRTHGAVLSYRMAAPWLCLLQLSSGGATRTLLIAADATDSESHRRLRAALLASQPSAEGWTAPPAMRR